MDFSCNEFIAFGYPTASQAECARRSVKPGSGLACHRTQSRGRTLGVQVIWESGSIWLSSAFTCSAESAKSKLARLSCSVLPTSCSALVFDSRTAVLTGWGALHSQRYVNQ